MNLETIISQYSNTRTFGIELEFFGIDQEKVQDVLEAAGVACYTDNGDDDYNCYGDNCGEDYCRSCNPESSARSGWKITDDGSIYANPSSSYDPGVELVSPILQGQDGLREVMKVAKLMMNAGAQVNKTCGFHVHIGAADLSGDAFINLVKRYALHENLIDSFMPRSRRESRNTYCRSVVNLLSSVSGIRHGSTMQSVASQFHDRYFKLNLCAYLRHGTVEFRHHSGTVSAEKIVNWIIFCQNFVENSLDSDTREVFTGLPTGTASYFNRRATASL